MDDRILALCELSNDLLFHKIPMKRIPYYVDASLEAGRQAAGRFAGRDIQALYREGDIEIRFAGGGKQSYGVLLRGQSVMDRTRCAVDVYRDSIRELAAHGGLTEERALEVHLAHEFFHIWEYREGRSIADELDSVVSASLLGWKRRAHIGRCGEVAAHAFAKELLGLPSLPNFYDYRYLIDTRAMTREDFDALTARMAALWREAGGEPLADREAEV